jgi:DNA-binding transcriptional LysR family regulator
MHYHLVIRLLSIAAMPIATDKLLHNIVSRLRLRHLPLLLALERQRSISRVAAEMNLSQPAVTKALREIEDIFTTPLFTRTRNGLEPTATGTAVLGHARMALADADALGRELAVIEAGLRGRLRIGAIPYTARAVLDAALAYGLNRTPRISVLVREGTTDELVVALRQHELDCAIARSFYLAGKTSSSNRSIARSRCSWYRHALPRGCRAADWTGSGWPSSTGFCRRTIRRCAARSIRCSRWPAWRRRCRSSRPIRSSRWPRCYAASRT